jgi:hypothetical protein
MRRRGTIGKKSTHKKLKKIEPRITAEGFNIEWIVVDVSLLSYLGHRGVMPRLSLDWVIG